MRLETIHEGNAGVMKQTIMKGVNPADADVVLSDLGFSIHINRLVAMAKGGGRKALVQMCANADRAGVYLSLNACPIRTALHPERMSEDALVSWYEGFGFKLVKPTADMQDSIFDHMSHLMLRYAAKN